MEQLITMIKTNLNENEETKSFSFPTYLFLFYVGENNFTLEKFFSLSEHFQVIKKELGNEIFDKYYQKFMIFKKINEGEFTELNEISYLDNLNLLDEDKNTPLIKAIKSEKELLIRKIMDLECNAGQINHLGETALMWLITLGFEDLSLILLEKYGNNLNLNQVDNTGDSALFLSIDRGFDKITDKLLDYDLDLTITDKENNSALIRLIGMKKFNLASKILEKSDKINLGLVNHKKDTALIWCCYHKQHKMALELLKHGIKCNLGNPDEHFRTALMYACQNNMINVALEILKYPEEANLKQIDIEGKTALYYAIENEMEIIVNDIKKYLF